MSMDTDFRSMADDFFVNVDLRTTLALPGARETVLHFCEAVQKAFPGMTSFFEREAHQYVLEGDRESGRYQWLEIHRHRLTAGAFNPPTVAAAYELHRWLVERSVYFLGVGGLDVESLDVLFGFNLDFRGNRDAVVAEALLDGSPLGALTDPGRRKCVEFEPSIALTLDEACDCQARVSVETRGNSYQVRTGQYDDEPISVYLTVRQYPTAGRVMDIQASLEQQCLWCEELACSVVVPQVVKPIWAAIAAAP